MPNHYFTTPDGPDRRREVTATVWDRALTWQTATGVFSHDGLDHATAVLLRHVEPRDGARTLLDLGCGWGPIATALAARLTEAQVWAVDVNERALDLTRGNARRFGLEVHAVLPDDVPPELTFDEIWSNPPIRIGKQALHELLLRWLPRLADDGVAHLVVGKNLGADSLHRWLEDQGWPTERAASAKGFRVLTVRRG